MKKGKILEIIFKKYGMYQNKISQLRQILESILNKYWQVFVKKYALYQTKIWDKYWKVFSTNITSILMKYAMYENKILTKGEYFLEKLVVFICLRDKLYNVNTF